MRQGTDRPDGCWTAHEISRRVFLKTGTAALGTLAYAMPAPAGPIGNGKSLIHIYLPGGPSHLDTFDMKPGSPASQRGEFQPIRTKTPGVEFCALLPRLARLTDQLTVIRGISGLRDEHSPSSSDCGWPADSLREIGGRPGMSAVLSAFSASSKASPFSVDLTGWTSTGFLDEQAFLFEPADLEQPTKKRRRQPAKSSAKASRRQPPRELVLRRKKSEFTGDSERFAIPAPALEWERESSETLTHYGIPARKENARFLEARRLVESGVRSVSFGWGYWDTHGNNFGQLRDQLPAFDQGLSALINDLSAQGRLNQTLILISGEFGRTPEINNGAGRDHWPETSCAILAGGELPHGRVIGQTDCEGRFPHDPVPMQAVIAAAYAALGIDAGQIRLSDPAGRRHALLPRTTLSSVLC